MEWSMCTTSASVFRLSELVDDFVIANLKGDVGILILIGNKFVEKKNTAFIGTHSHTL